ncbi:MAG: non-ribosomal peptide synthetase, partial [Pedobacter sp.]
NTSLYHIPMNLRLSGDLDVVALRASLDYLVVRHEILRSRLKSNSGFSYQEILSPETGFNLIKLSSTELTSDVDSVVEQFVSRSFNFESDTLCRGLLIELSPQEHILSIVFHHVISDGWSMDIFYRELCTCYNSFTLSLSPELTELSVQYVDFSVWQRSWLQGEVLRRQLDYWLSRLSGYSYLNLPTDMPRPAEQSYLGGRVSQFLSLSTSSELNELCRNRSVTLFMGLLAILKGLLSRYANQDDVTLGTPIANRRHSCLDNVIGFFVNTLVLRTHVDRHSSISDLIGEVEKTTLDAYEHQDIPFEQLVEHLNVSRDLGRHPLFQVMFVLHSLSSSEDVYFSGINSSLYTSNLSISSKFDLTFNVEELSTGLSISIDYA